MPNDNSLYVVLVDTKLRASDWSVTDGLKPAHQYRQICHPRIQNNDHGSLLLALKRHRQIITYFLYPKGGNRPDPTNNIGSYFNLIFKTSAVGFRR